jgi:hypothetical protein
VAVHFRVRNRRTKRSCCFEALYVLLTFNTATPNKFLSLIKYCVAMRVRKLKQLLGKDHKKGTVRFDNRGGEEEGNAQGENLVVILMKRTAYQYGSFSSEFSNRKKKRKTSIIMLLIVAF